MVFRKYIIVALILYVIWGNVLWSGGERGVNQWQLYNFEAQYFGDSDLFPQCLTTPFSNTPPVPKWKISIMKCVHCLNFRALSSGNTCLIASFPPPILKRQPRCFPPYFRFSLSYIHPRTSLNSSSWLRKLDRSISRTKSVSAWRKETMNI